MLRDVEGQSFAEIADVLGVSVALVKARVHRARLFLRARLGDFMTTLRTDGPRRATNVSRDVLLRSTFATNARLLSPPRTA